MLHHATGGSDEQLADGDGMVGTELEELHAGRKEEMEPEIMVVGDRRKAVEDEVHEKVRNLKIMFLIATAYASNLGGTGVITGSATNIIALDLIRKDA